MLNIKHGALLLGLVAGAALTALIGIFWLMLLQVTRPAQAPIPSPVAVSTPTPTTAPSEETTTAPGDEPTGAPTEVATIAPTRTVNVQSAIGYELVYQKQDVASDGVNLIVTANCPPGKKVLGGGSYQGSIGWYVWQSGPVADGRGWTVEYYPVDSSDPSGGVGAAWAVCAVVVEEATAAASATAPGVAGYEIVRGNEVSSEGVNLRVTATCPEAKKVLGGGSYQGDVRWYVWQSGPNSDGSGWTVEYYPMDSDSPSGGVGAAWAICATVDEGAPPGAQGVIGYQIVRGDQVSSEDVNLSLTVACPEGKKALSGGSYQGNVSWYLWQGGPLDDGAGWTVKHYPIQLQNPATGYAKAICAIVDEAVPN